MPGWDGTPRDFAQGGALDDGHVLLDPMAAGRQCPAATERTGGPPGRFALATLGDLSGSPRSAQWEAMARRSFVHRNETFGFDTTKPWALDSLSLLFHVPRAYQPLVGAWERRHPGTQRALNRLVDMDFVAYQGPVIVDTRTAELATAEGRKVARYRTTAAGHRLLVGAREDSRTLEDAFPHLNATNVIGLRNLLDAFDLDGSHAQYGLSVAHAVELSGLAGRSGRWWVRALGERNMIRELDVRHADVREVIPAHWRVTRLLCHQLIDVLDSFPDAPTALRADFRLSRSRFLDDIDPARVGISGATDFDHDIEAQRILSDLLLSSRCASRGVFSVEPRLNLPITTTQEPWTFAGAGNDTLFYQPDAIITERVDAADGRSLTRRSIIEYERFQTRRDAWNHVERFLGYLHTMTLPMEAAALRFVVDSDSRVRSYVALIEAYCDYALDHTDQLPANNVTLAVSSSERLSAATDPLDENAWFRIALPAGTDDAVPVLHPTERSPYDEYFSRT